MKLPGFTADHCLYKLSTPYAILSEHSVAGPGAGIEPQFVRERCYSWCGPCINGARSCTFVCFPGDCHYEYVPPSSDGGFGGMYLVCHPTYSYYTIPCAIKSVVGR